MELIRSKNNNKNRFFERYNTLKRPETYERKSDKLLIDSLRDDNFLIKQRLRELESKLAPSRESLLNSIAHLFFEVLFINL
jgi:hypothetical protein